MNAGNTGSRLISVALCALIVVLIVKLTAAVIGLHSYRATPVSVSEAIAKDEKPKATSEQAQVQTKAKTKPSASDSLSALQQKEVEIRKREEQLKDREERLSKLEKEVEQKIKDLLTLQKQVQSVQNDRQESQNAKARGLAKIYGTMKPKEAAKLLENLDDKLVIGIISIMTPDQAAAVLALMEVKKAAKISEALLGK